VGRVTERVVGGTTQGLYVFFEHRKRPTKLSNAIFRDLPLRA